MKDFMIDAFLHLKINTNAPDPFIFEFTLTNAGFLIILLGFALRWLWKVCIINK